MFRRPVGTRWGEGEGIMDQDLFWLRDETKASKEKRSSTRRASRPMTRLQEIALLSVAFGFGAVLQLAYLLHGTLAP